MSKARDIADGGVLNESGSGSITLPSTVVYDKIFITNTATLASTMTLSADLALVAMRGLVTITGAGTITGSGVISVGSLT